MEGTAKPHAYEGVIVMLARLDPGKQPQIHSEVRDHIADAFRHEEPDRQPDVADFGCLGRYDAIYVVRAPALAFLPAAHIAHVHGLKKLDVQYGYVAEKDAVAFWGAWNGNIMPPLLLLAYLRIRDDYTFATSGEVHEQGIRPVVAEAITKAGFPVHLLVRALGWPDYIVLASSNDLGQLTRFAQSRLWNVRTDRLPKQQLGKLKQNSSAIGESEPVFSRSYTLIGYQCDSDLRAVSGHLASAQVDLRLRPGADSAAYRVFLAGRKRMKGFQADFALQLGSEDAALWLRARRCLPWRRKSIRASSLLEWYRDHLLMPAAKPQAYRDPPVNKLITTSEMRLDVPLDTETPLTPMLGSYREVEPLQPPPRFVSAVAGKDMLLAEPVGVSLSSMCRMVNWAIVNEGIQRDFWDLYEHTEAFLEHVRFSLERERGELRPQLLEDIRLHGRLFSEAFSQRLTGSYYDLGADSPELLLEYQGGIQKLIAALYAVQVSLFTIVARELGRADIRPCYIVSKEAETAECVRSGAAFTLRLCSSLAFDPRAALHPVAHEIGHMLRHLFVSAADVPPEERPAGQYAWSRWDPQTSRFWFEPELQALQQWATGYQAWARQALLLAGDILEEVFAEAVGFLLVEASFESYAAAVRRLVPRLADPLPLVITCWVITQLAQALTQHGWPRDAGDQSLLQFLATRGPVDIGPLLVQSSGGQPPRAVTSGNERHERLCQDLFRQGWQEAVQYGLTDEAFVRCLVSTVDRAQAFLIFLEECTKGTYRSSVDGFRRLAGDHGLAFNPAVLEDLWRSAMAALRATRGAAS